MKIPLSERLSPDLVLQPEISERDAARLRHVLHQVANNHGSDRAQEIDTICSLLRQGHDRNSLVCTVLSVPHPQFIAALEDRFGPDMLSSLTARCGTACEAYEVFKPSAVPDIDRDFMLQFLPRISARAVRICRVAALHAMKTDDLDLLLTSARASGATEAQLFSWFPTILPFGQSKERIHGWAGRVFDAQIKDPAFFRDSRVGNWLESSRIHLISALLASGADLRPHIAAYEASFGSPNWARALKSLPHTNHARLTVQTELAALGPSSAIFASDKGQLIGAILNAVEA